MRDHIPFTVIVINRDRDTGRLAHMTRELERLRLPFTRFSAVEGANLPANLSYYFPDEPSRFLSPGETGCYASHLSICRMIAERRIIAPVLVLEDDVGLAADLGDTLASTIAALPPGWDIVRLSNPPKLATLLVAALPSADLVWYSQPPTATGGYLISGSGARKFLAPVKRRLPVDDDLRRVWIWRMETYGIDPPPVRQSAEDVSVIDALAGGARTDPGRRAANRRRRRAEHRTRIAHVYRRLGVTRASCVEAVNLLARLMPRPQRLGLFAWARRRFAHTASPETKTPQPFGRGASISSQ